MLLTKNADIIPAVECAVKKFAHSCVGDRSAYIRKFAKLLAIPYSYAVMKRLLCLILLICGTAHSAWADQSSFDCPAKSNLPRAQSEEVLRKVQERYKTISSMSAAFYQDSYLKALEVSETSAGQVWFLRPGKMKWHYKDPEEQIFTVKDNTLWLYQIAEKQVVIDEFKNVLITDLPVAFLLGMGNLQRDFKLVSACRNDDLVVLTLNPQRKKEQGEQDLQQFQLLVGGDTYLPHGAKVTDMGGNATSILFNKLTFDAPLKEDLFATEFPKGTDIDDKRLGIGVSKERQER